MTFNHGVPDAQINPPETEEARCEDCGSLDCDEICWEKNTIDLCRACTKARLLDAGELDENETD